MSHPHNHATASGEDDPNTAPDFTAAALITIDTQRDTLDGGPLEVPGTSQALPAMAGLLHACRELGVPIVHVVRLYHPDGSNADLCRRQALERGAPMLNPGSPGAQLAPELLPDADSLLDAETLLAGGVQALGTREVAIYKARWGAFYQTPLQEHLRESHISTLIFSGCNYPNCPRTSIYEASERDYRILLARDGISGLYQQGERELQNIGVRIMSSADIVGELKLHCRPRR